MPLLEREAELTAIAGVVERGGVVVVEGGAGIGKTALLYAALQRAADLQHEVLRARGSELEEGFAFGVVRQLFERRLAGAEPAERDALFAGPAAAAQPLLSGRFIATTADDVSFAVLHGLYWLASNLAGRRHLVLCVDDVHWADAPSLRWLAYVASRVEGLQLSLLLGLRPTGRTSTEPPLRALQGLEATVRPALLSRDAAAVLVRDALGDATDDELCTAIWRESGGNPFYLSELLRPRGALDRAGVPVDAMSLLDYAGEGVAEHVAARVRALDPRALRVAQSLAILGDGCELRLAAALAGVPVPDAARLAAGLFRAEVLAGDDPPRFLHPIVRQAVEASLGRDGRDAQHLAAARLLHADGARPGIIAAHLLRLRPAADPWIVVRLREAAAAAVESGAPATGAQLLRRALAEPPAPDERIELLRAAGVAEALTGRESAVALLVEALGLAGDARGRAEIGLELAEAHGSAFRWVEAFDACERALTELGDADPALATRLEANLVVCGLRDARRAVRAVPVLEHLATCPLDGGPAEAYAVGRGIEGLWFNGLAAEQVARPLAQAFAEAGPRPANWDLRAPGLWALIVAEGYEAAHTILEGMLAEVQRSGSARGMFVTYAILSLLQFRLGALPDADANARVALRVMEEADFAPGLALGMHVLADVAVEAGDLAEAEALLDRLPKGAVPPGLGTVHVPPARGRLRLAQGRPAEALAEFQLGQEMFSQASWGARMYDNGFVHLRSGMALGLIALGQPSEAADLARSELQDARAFGAPRALGLALRVAGLVAGSDEGLTLLEEAVSVHRRSPAILERAHSLTEYGAALRRAGRRSAAREPLAEALDLAARCGARRLAARAREELRTTGARPRREWRTGVEALTPSELRVARLAAEGRTNREIAQVLYVTPKTVEGYLARVYTKLDISGRDALRQGLEGEKTGVTTR